MTVPSIGSYNEFEKLCKYEKSIYFKFTAAWCSPCKLLQPTLDTLGNDYIIYSIDIDEFSSIADDFDVSSIPTIIHIKSGSVHSRYTGGNIDNIIDFFKNRK